MYRPQYLEQRFEITTIYSGWTGYESIRTPLKSNRYKRKESHEVIPFRGKKRLNRRS